MINQWRKLLHFSPTERKLLVGSVILLLLIQAGLRIWGLKHIQTALFQISKHCNRKRTAYDQDGVIIHLVAKAVQRAGGHGAIQASCLARTLCTWFLLLQYGIESDLRIGVNRTGGTFAAHAWVERDGQVLNDRPDIHDFFFAFDTSIQYQPLSQS